MTLKDITVYTVVTLKPTLLYCPFRNQVPKLRRYAFYSIRLKISDRDLAAIRKMVTLFLISVKSKVIFLSCLFKPEQAPPVGQEILLD